MSFSYQMGYVGYSASPVPDRGWEIPDRALTSSSMLLPASSNMLQDPREKNHCCLCNTSTSGKAVPRRSLPSHSQDMQPHPMASQSSHNLPRSFTWLKAWAILGGIMATVEKVKKLSQLKSHFHVFNLTFSAVKIYRYLCRVSILWLLF